MPKVLIALSLTAVLSACGGGSTTPNPAQQVISRTGYLSAPNTHATDLLESWNEPATVQDALELQPGDISNVVSIPRIVAATGATPKDVQVLGVRNNATHVHWRAGAAGHLGIDFNWRDLEDAPSHVRRAAERAAKAWSYRLADNFTLEPDIDRFNHEGIPTAGADVTVSMWSFGQNRSSGGHWDPDTTETDVETWYGRIDLSRTTYNNPDYLSHVLVHELGHVLGHDFNQGGGKADPRVPPSIARYVDWNNRTFNGPRSIALNGGRPIPIQTDWGHFEGTPGDVVCETVMSYCGSAVSTAPPPNTSPAPSTTVAPKSTCSPASEVRVERASQTGRVIEFGWILCRAAISRIVLSPVPSHKVGTLAPRYRIGLE